MAQWQKDKYLCVHPRKISKNLSFFRWMNNHLKKGMPKFYYFFLLSLVDFGQCTTEWFGDLRAHLNPPKSPPFHDVVYDESDCPSGLESVAIPEFVYFGEMIATKSVREHADCLQFCIETPRCKAVNFFESLDKKEPETGFCELLIEGQYDNPRLMRPFHKATYYEKIHCRVASEEEEQPFIFNESGEGKDLLIGEDNNDNKNGSESENGQNQTPKQEKAEQKPHHTDKQQQKQMTHDPTGSFIIQQDHEAAQMDKEQTSTTDPSPDIKRVLTLKKLAEKVHEFNERFKS